MSFWQDDAGRHAAAVQPDRDRIAEYDGPLSLESYYTERGRPLDCRFRSTTSSTTALWVQRQVAPDVDRRVVSAVHAPGGRLRADLTDGEQLSARTGRGRGGASPISFTVPASAAGCRRTWPRTPATTATSAVFSGRRVLVVGGGQSALESAALLHEHGAEVEVVVRAGPHQLAARRQVPPQARSVCAASCTRPPTSVRWGCRGSSPCRTHSGDSRASCRTRSRTGRSAQPARRGCSQGSSDVPIHLGRVVSQAATVGSGVRVELDDGSNRDVDHVLFGTGYRVDVAQYPFLDGRLVERGQARRRLSRAAGREWSHRSRGCTSLAHLPLGASARSCGSSPADGSAVGR